MEDESAVLVERCAGYRVITLNRPKQLNAFNEAMHQALKRALTFPVVEGVIRDD